MLFEELGCETDPTGSFSRPITIDGMPITGEMELIDSANGRFEPFSRQKGERLPVSPHFQQLDLQPVRIIFWLSTSNVGDVDETLPIYHNFETPHTGQFIRGSTGIDWHR